MIAKMGQDLPTAPRKKQLTQFYLHLYYKKKGIKDVVDHLWPAEKNKPTLPGQKPVKQLDFSNKITKQYLERETPEFLRQLEMERDAEFKQAEKVYHEALDAVDKPPETAEAYHT